MDIACITPLVITWNESENLFRCLSQLTWASQILVVDSGSTDDTLAICRSFSQVRVIHRPFDSFASQCNFGLQQITTEWVLSLDADYIVPQNFAEVAQGLNGQVAGYRAAFRYCIFGRPLRASLYPPRVVLYRRLQGRYADIGHGHRLQLEGMIAELACRIDHDDRKPMTRWLDSQRKYALKEAVHLATTQRSHLPMVDRIRQGVWLAVPLVLLYTLFWKRCLLDGWAGWYYALQRTYAELLLSLELLDRKLRPRETVSVTAKGTTSSDTAVAERSDADR